MESIWKVNCKNVSIFFFATDLSSVAEVCDSVLLAFGLIDFVLFVVIRLDDRESN